MHISLDPKPQQDMTQSRLPVFDENTCPEDMEKMMRNAMRASAFLKAISHEGRLMILCHLASGEKSVTELEDLLSARQAAVSQPAFLVSILFLWTLAVRAALHGSLAL